MSLKKILHNKTVLILFAIVIVGSLLRLTHFGEWMHYELDQSRDFRITHAAIEYGPGELTLQGPRAAGSFLRLGPLFYYMQYVSALVFGDTPAGANMIVALLNILAIPLFYIFSRRFFGTRLSLGLTALFASSLFLVTYSRFGWNPNTIPFFMLAFVYCLLRVSDASESFTQTFCGIRLQRGHWLICAAIVLAFLTNMHFLALIVAPLIGSAYLAMTRPRMRWTFWVGAVVAFFFLNAPLIVNDMKTGGDNVKEFIEVVTDRGSGEEQRNILDKFVKNAGLHAQYFWLTTTGYQYAEMPELKGRDIRCDHFCRQNIWISAVAAITLLASGIAWLYFYRRTSHEMVHKISAVHVQKKNFLLLIGLWQAITFIVYVPLAYDIAPRFFLFLAPLNIILLGLIIHAGFLRGKRHDYILGWLIITLFILANVVFVSRYFNELSRASHDTTLRIDPDRILKEKNRMTLSQIEEIVDYMAQQHHRDGAPIFMHGQAEFKRAFWERIDVRGIDRAPIPQDFDKIYSDGHYFFIVRTQSDQGTHLLKYDKAFTIEQMRTFGTLTVYYLMQKPGAITAQKKEFKPKQRDPKFSTGVQKRYLWRQIFSDEKL